MKNTVTPTTLAIEAASTARVPPPNAPSGGTWGQQSYRGAWSTAATVGGLCVCFIPFVLDTILLTNFDRRMVYLAPNGDFYNSKGQLVGKVEQDKKFRHTKFVPDEPQRVIVDEIGGSSSKRANE